jgi:hypothetical protein
MSIESLGVHDSVTGDARGDDYGGNPFHAFFIFTLDKQIRLDSNAVIRWWRSPKETRRQIQGVRHGAGRGGGADRR